MSETRRVPVQGKKGRQPEPDFLPTPPAECSCPRLDPADWDDVESDWADIAFVKGATAAVLGVPVGFAGLQERLRGKARRASAPVPDDAMFLLGKGRFRRAVMLEVEGVERGTRGVVFPGGVAYSRLVAAPWGEMQRVVDETKARARQKYGRAPDATWVWYLTCRECSHERDFETLIVAHYRRAP